MNGNDVRPGDADVDYELVGARLVSVVRDPSRGLTGGIGSRYYLHMTTTDRPRITLNNLAANLDRLGVDDLARAVEILDAKAHDARTEGARTRWMNLRDRASWTACERGWYVARCGDHYVAMTRAEYIATEADRRELADRERQFAVARRAEAAVA